MINICVVLLYKLESSELLRFGLSKGNETKHSACFFIVFICNFVLKIIFLEDRTSLNMISERSYTMIMHISCRVQLQVQFKETLSQHLTTPNFVMQNFFKFTDFLQSK